MLKLLIWWLGFELKNLERIVNPKHGTEKYFAYGGNLDVNVLARRKIRPLAEEPFVLRDHALRFSHPGPFEGMGYASISASSGASVYGKLYTLTRTDAERMDFYELARVLMRYERIYLTQTGHQFFTYRSRCPQDDLKPSSGYLASVLDGLRTLPAIPATYIEGMEKTPVVCDLRVASALGFIVNLGRPGPAVLNGWLRVYDRLALWMFVRIFKERSFTRQWIRS